MSTLRSSQTSRFRKGTLASVVGVVATVSLLTTIPREESGRTVEVKVSDAGEASVRHVSGKQYLTAYLDIAGVPTACDGITRDVRPNQRFTEAECVKKLENELVIHAQGVMACTPSLSRPGRDWQRAAAVSLAYNIGVAAWCGSTARRQFDAGNIRAGCEAFLMWDKARVKGVLQPVAGLKARRGRERDICLRGL